MIVDALSKSDRPELLARANHMWFDFAQLDIWHATEMFIQTVVLLDELSG